MKIKNAIIKPDYSNKPELVKYHSKRFKSNFDFAQFVSERLDYFSDRFCDEHIEFFDLLWIELKRRLSIENREK